MTNSSKQWWKEAIIYQIYPRSFKDSNGDGIGDLQGIISKLDYLQYLGVDVLWLSPFYESPNIDNGYDVSDYQSVHPEFGTMADFDELLEEAHNRGLKIVIDLVVNHTSDQHAWFQEAKKSKDNPYREYYIWREADGINNWVSFFSGSAWEWNEATQDYYLHLFAKQQPDLNWDNPALRQEIYAMMRFWLQKGVDGFRLDVIPLLSKDNTFPNYPEGRFGDLSIYANGPRIHEYLHEMNREVFSKFPCFTIGECFGVSAEDGILYVSENRQELDMLYHFDHAVPREEYRFINPASEFTLSQLLKVIQQWYNGLQPDGWLNFYWGNHDNPRVISRFGDPKTYHFESGSMLATLLFTLPGTPNIYQGDELGLPNTPFYSVDEFNDVQVKNAYEALVVSQNYSEDTFLHSCNLIARDHARTPIPWDSSENTGFSTGKSSWLKINPMALPLNIINQLKNPQSLFHAYKSLIALRKQQQSLVYGHFEILSSNESLIHFRRDTLQIIVNFSFEVLPFAIPSSYVLYNNYPSLSTNQLMPFQALILQ